MKENKTASSLQIIEERMEAIQALRPIDDLCGSVFFQDVICTQILLREVMAKPGMEIRETAPQSVVRNIFGRGGQLDVLAFDAESGAYNLEFQREKKGAVLDRAFFNYALLARHLVDKGTDFENFPYTGVVFVQEDDFFHANQPVTNVRFVLDSNPPVSMKSKLNVVYVNTNVKDNTTMLGKILHDLRCASPKEMLVPELAERMNQVKNPKGKEMEFMCELLEEVRRSSEQKGRMEMARKGAASMFFFGSSYDCVHDAFGEMLDKEELLQIQREAKKDIERYR
ncbi:MAG: hypothetical protein IJ521_12890 [Schwartzia sp.]|nr:hypothetical protein [Schwartzia sp. (in: firmicutes)]